MTPTDPSRTTERIVENDPSRTTRQERPVDNDPSRTVRPERSVQNELSGADLVDRAAERSSVAGTLTGLFRYRHLLRNLVLKDLKLKYRGSVFGFLWSLLNPLLMIVVYTIAFTYILRLRTEDFVFYLMLGILAWTFFAGSLTMATGAIADNGGLVRTVFFPRAILPAAGVLFNLSQYLLTAVVFLPVMLIFYRVRPDTPMLLFPVFVALQALFTIGLALVLATATAFFRDVKHLVEVALAVLFWLTPVVYELGQIPGRLRPAIRLTPLTPFVSAYHDIFYYGRWPDAATWTLAIVYAGAALVVGLWLTVRYEEQFAERV
jgi:ABC-type polysaccharide/polyol phosphate export permease